MVAQEGFLYEENAYNALSKYGISTGGTAGASHDKPDLTIQSGNKKTGCELKISPTAAGSLVMKYHNNTWDYGNVKDDVEKMFLMEIGEKFNLLKEMNKSGSYGTNWRNKTPSLQNKADGGKIYIGASNVSEAYAIDIKQFGGQNEIKIPVPAKAISDYYNSKKCHYINVGTHGFYLLNSDYLGLNKKLASLGKPSIPDFGSSANCIIRVRCQDKSGSYQFVMTLQFSKVKKSPYNIAPLQSGSKSTIDQQLLKKDPILLAF